MILTRDPSIIGLDVADDEIDRRIYHDQSVYEREQREKGEIDSGRTLGEIAELKRWEAEGGLSGFASHGPEGEPGE